MLAMRVVVNPTLDAAGRFTVRITEFQKVVNAIVSDGTGFKGEIHSIADNLITVQVRRYDYPATVAGIAVPAPAGAITATFRLLAEGI